jgi:quercetin dioxygenase-like cupin family protein
MMLAQAQESTRMVRRNGFAHVFSAAMLAGSTVPASAQEVKRTELSRTDLTGVEGKEIVIQLVEVPPGSTSIRHFHHGEEVFYVLEGAMVQVPGQDPQARATGSVGVNKREVPHAGYKVIGDKPLKLLTVYVVDKGKPLQVEVK